MAGVLQFLAEEILILSGQVCIQNGHKLIAPKHINLALRSDEEMSKLMFNSQISQGNIQENIHEHLIKRN